MAVAEIVQGFTEIGLAFFRQPSIWWVLTPILMVWFVTSVYAGRHKEDRSSGWNAALGNGLSLFWITVSSLKDLFAPHTDYFSIGKLIFVLTIGVYSFFVIYIAFTRKLRSSIFFWIAARSIGYYLSIICILWVHNFVLMSIWIMIDCLLLYVVVVTMGFIMKMLIPAKEVEMESQEPIKIS